jgi:methylmalonyl-CoA mutase N-terminal domain/subunit
VVNEAESVPAGFAGEVRLRAFRANRSGNVPAALSALDSAARENRNLMPFIVDCVRQDCTVGEIIAKLTETFGEHKDQGF